MLTPLLPCPQYRGDTSVARGAQSVPKVAEHGSSRLRGSGSPGPTDQELQRWPQPLHLVHYGGPRGYVAQLTENHQGTHWLSSDLLALINIDITLYDFVPIIIFTKLFEILDIMLIKMVVA